MLLSLSPANATTAAEAKTRRRRRGRKVAEEEEEGEEGILLAVSGKKNRRLYTSVRLLFSFAFRPGFYSIPCRNSSMRSWRARSRNHREEERTIWHFPCGKKLTSIRMLTIADNILVSTCRKKCTLALTMPRRPLYHRQKNNTFAEK